MDLSPPATGVELPGGGRAGSQGAESAPTFPEAGGGSQLAATRLGKTEAAVVALSQRALKALRESMDRLGEYVGLAKFREERLELLVLSFTRTSR